jgi:hypothetical protein
MQDRLAARVAEPDVLKPDDRVTPRVATVAQFL